MVFCPQSRGGKGSVTGADAFISPSRGRNGSATSTGNRLSRRLLYFRQPTGTSIYFRLPVHQAEWKRPPKFALSTISCRNMHHCSRSASISGHVIKQQPTLLRSRADVSYQAPIYSRLAHAIQSVMRASLFL